MGRSLRQIGYLVLSLFWISRATGQTTTVTYSASDAVFPNPERGFSVMSWANETTERGDRAFSVTALQNYRTATDPAAKGAHVTLVRRIYYLTSYLSKPIDQAILNRIQSDCDIVRQAGVKLVITFAYADGGSFGSTDVPLSKMLQDITALGPTLTANADVIALYQAGFVGIYGEWWGSTYNLGADYGYGITGYGHSDTTAQRQIIQKYLSVIPSTRFVLVRYPRIKRFIWGTTPLPLSDAYSGKETARIGHYNDAFCVWWDDYGTYDGQPNRGSYSDTTVIKPYVAAESQYLPNVAETDDNTSFTSSANVLSEMARMHMSSQNPDYYLPATDAWRSDGSFVTMDKNLGYRFQLISSTLSSAANAGGTMRVRFSLKNLGWAAPYNPRGLELILRNTATGALTSIDLRRQRQSPYDPRYWFAGQTITLDTTVTLPASMGDGTYEALLNLPDPTSTLHDRPEYSIQLANTNVWESSTGYNDLHTTITVGTGSGSTPPSAPVAVSPTDGTLNVPTTATLSWGAVAGATGYNVQVSDDSLFSTFALNDPLVSATSDQVAGLGSNRIYFWRVRANTASGWGDFCSRLKFTTVDRPSPTGSFAATPSSLPAGGGTVTLTWTSANADSAAINQGIGRVALQGSLTRNVSATQSFTLTLYGKTRQTYIASVVVSTALTPDVPVAISPSEGAVKVPLTTTAVWHPAARATKYHLQISDDSLFSTFAVDDSAVADTSRQIAGLGGNRIYFWRVRGLNANGAGNFCQRVKFTTTDRPAPTGTFAATPAVVANAGDQVTLSWTSANADSAFIDQGIGRVPLQGSLSVAVPARQTYTLSLEGVSVRTYSVVVSVQSSLTPDVPLAVSPSEGMLNVPLSTSLRWHPSARATRYHVQLSNDSLFSTFVVNDSTVADTVAPIKGLGSNRVYFWRVRALNSTGASSFTFRVKFTTLAQVTKNGHHRIPLTAGWNMVSSNVAVSSTTMEAVLTPILPSLVIAKDANGAVYWPAAGVSTLDSWSQTQGYQICMKAADTLDLSGDPIVPDQTPLTLSKGWNLIPYLRTSTLDVDRALASIQGSITIVKDHLGHVYWPGAGVNTLVAMDPGEGYQVFLTEPAVLSYPADDTAAVSGKSSPTIDGAGQPALHAVSVHYLPAKSNTGNCATLLVEGVGLHDGDEIGVWTAANLLIGSGVAVNQRAIVVLWGDDPTTTDVVEGASHGDVLRLTQWSAAASREVPLRLKSWQDVLSSSTSAQDLTYAGDAVMIAQVDVVPSSDGAVPNAITLEQNYPNPFNPSTVISYSLPKDAEVHIEIFNAVGQRVGVLVNEMQSAGRHSTVFQAGNLSSGVYYCTLRAGLSMQSRSMLLVK